MPHPYPYPEWLADEIKRNLRLLTEQIDQLPPADAMQVIAHVLDSEGLFDGVIGFISVSSTFAAAQAEDGALPSGVALDLTRATNALNDIGGALEESNGILQDVSAPPVTPGATLPLPAPLVVRRHR